MDVDGAGRDARLDREVLDLLVGDAPDEHVHAEDRVARGEAHQRREGDRDVRADVGDELGDEPRPQRERKPVGQAEQREHDPAGHHVDGGEDDPGGDVPADLDPGQLPRGEERHLDARRHPLRQPVPQGGHARPAELAGAADAATRPGAVPHRVGAGPGQGRRVHRRPGRPRLHQRGGQRNRVRAARPALLAAPRAVDRHRGSVHPQRRHVHLDRPAGAGGLHVRRASPRCVGACLGHRLPTGREPDVRAPDLGPCRGRAPGGVIRVRPARCAAVRPPRGTHGRARRRDDHGDARDLPAALRASPRRRSSRPLGSWRPARRTPDAHYSRVTARW